MKKIKITKTLVLRAVAIAAAAVVTTGGTMALFNDSRILADNRIAAGKFVLSLDNECHYDGMVCKKNDTGVYEWTEENNASSTLPMPEMIGEPCECSWDIDEDSADKLIFNLDDVKPGDNGENTVSIHIDDNPGWICADFSVMDSYENECVAPEVNDGDTTCGLEVGQGELQDNILFSVWIDNGNGDEKYACDNILDGGETYLMEDVPASGVLPIVDSSTSDEGITEGCVGISWSVPRDADNTIQTDSLEGDITFTAYQTRNNADFICEGAPQPEKGSIKVTKIANGGDATFGFIGDAGDFNITTSGGTGTKIITGLTSGSYDIEESDLPDGWSMNSNDCEDIEVVAGETAECTIENTKEKECIDQADVMLVLDRSGSVDSAMPTLKNAALSFVAALNPNGGVHMGQSSFATLATLDTQLTGDQPTINAGINSLVSYGFTDLKDGIFLASGELASVRDRLDATTPDYMVIITDGEPNRPGCTGSTSCPAARTAATNAAEAAKLAGVTIYVVGVGDQVDPAYLQTIATGASYYYSAADYGDLGAILSDIASCDGD